MRDEWHLQEGDADDLLERWEAEASVRGLARREVAYWRDAEEWSGQQRGRRG
jgi:hypothetical protein